VITRFVPSTVIALLVSETVLIGCAFAVGMYFLSEIDPMVWLLYDDGLIRIALLLGALLVGFYFQDLYTVILPPSRFFLVQQFCLVFGLGFLFQALLSYGAPTLVLPRRAMMFGSAVSLVALPLWRSIYASLVMQAASAERLLFLGASNVSRRIVERIQTQPELGMKAIGFVADVGPEEEPPLEAPVLGPMPGFRQIVRDTRPNRVVVGLSERRQAMPVLDLLDVNFSGVQVEEAAVVFEHVFKRVSTEELRPSQLIFSRELGPRPRTLQLQALYSFLIALIGIVLTAPLMLLVGILVRLTSPGPALYRQVRTGRNGVPFTVYKFRSMRADAEDTTGAVWATKGDARITAVGRWLRKLRIDELPQFFNVLKGEMLIVGPRPERPEFVATLSQQIPFYPQRHCIRPGITGWAQINHKYGDTLEDTVVKLEFDLYYIKNLSPSLDMYIIFQTLKVMLLSRGAQ
jgi:sugar transferase (PEP-CTERM system associated)